MFIIHHPVIGRRVHLGGIHPVDAAAELIHGPVFQPEGQSRIGAALPKGDLAFPRPEPAILQLGHHGLGRGPHRSHQPGGLGPAPGGIHQYPAVVGGQQGRQDPIQQFVHLGFIQGPRVPPPDGLQKPIQGLVAKYPLIRPPLLVFPPGLGPKAILHKMPEGAGIIGFQPGSAAPRRASVQLQGQVVAKGRRG